MNETKQEENKKYSASRLQQDLTQRNHNSLWELIKPELAPKLARLVCSAGYASLAFLFVFLVDRTDIDLPILSELAAILTSLNG